MQVTSDNANDVLGNGQLKFVYSSEENTGYLFSSTKDSLKGKMVMNGSKIIASVYAKDMSLVISSGSRGLNMESTGYGVYLDSDFSSRLYVYGKINSSCYESSLWSSGKIEVDGDIDLVKTSIKVNSPVCAANDISINGNVKVSVEGDNQYCITSSEGAIKLTKNVEIDTQNSYGEGIYCPGDIYIGGSLNATTISSALYSSENNIEVVNNVTINYVGDERNTPISADAGEITIRGNLSIVMEKGTQRAIFGKYGVTIDGDVDITNNGGDGIRSTWGNININGNVTGKCVDALLRTDETLNVIGDIDISEVEEPVKGRYAVFGWNGINIDGNVKITLNRSGRCIEVLKAPIIISGDVELVNHGSSGAGIEAFGDIYIDGNFTSSTDRFALQSSSGGVEVVKNLTANFYELNNSFGAVTGNGGDVIIGGDVSITMVKGAPYAIFSENNTTIGGNVNILNNYESGMGIYAEKGSIKFPLGKKWVVQTGWKALVAKEIIMGQGNVISVPNNPVIGTYSFTDNNTTYNLKTVYEANGTTPAKRVVINCVDGKHDFTSYVSNSNGTHKVVCKDCGAVQKGHESDSCINVTTTTKKLHLQQTARK